ncbi:antibiotic biosynthesis monooxygenase [Mesorhizobium sp. BH1-1-5]|uniref:putative quinol monooxygenase n=1 Tax=Mesorhizobium sp. BH1-1-5 TaxID=2876661 RepID=UPI001CCD43D9|nr:putative quinol monooxygenase [Mesorhizobium sp. BH1-1-5]MBZ9988040.1 antibiotic biosynthesis monooxygenase [Mesorhizobium sp. BH1-1-5]
MLLIIGTIRLPPDRLEQAKPVMQSMVLASRAEPGCLGYSYAQDVLEAGLIHVSEAWSDRVALETHFKSAHIAEWRASWAELGIGDRKLTLYETDGGAPT